MLSSDEDRQLKEILYLLLEKVRATKAALYLLEGSSTYRLATSYGFGKSDRFSERVLRTDPLAVTVYEHREPTFVNDVRQAGRLLEVMEGASSTRILTAPLYVDRRIIGILDIRDKAAHEPFTINDVAWVSEVLRLLGERVRQMPRFGAYAVEAEEEESPFEQTGARAKRFSSAPTPPASFEPTPLHDSRFSMSSSLAKASVDQEASPSLLTPTALARQLVTERLGAPGPARGLAAPATPSEREVGFYRLYLETCLQLPDVELAAISCIEARQVLITLASRREVAEDAEAALFENLEKVFAKAGALFALPASRNRNLVTLPGPEATPLHRSEIAAIQSSVLSVSAQQVSILSLVFRQGPGAEAREGLKNVHLLVKSTLSEIRGSLRYREAYRGLVNKLLEPGLKKYTALKTHSFNVGRLARKLGTKLGLGPTEIEQVTVAAILHDVGMRDLNYDEIYTKRNLSDEDLKLAREHPRVGAFLVEEIPWPYDVAPLIRHHHERWDGAGYPDDLRAEQIPFGARIIHLCEAFDAMTSPASYRTVLSVSQALEILSSKGGTQFDPELAPAFKQMVEGFKH